MKVGSLFTGCMGLDLGLEAAGMEIAWACESDEACRRVIRRHRPDLPVYEDVRMFAEWEGPYGIPPVDVIAGGFPCQDLSQAGSGAGLTGERSGLWEYMRRAIRALRPGYVIIENVPGLATKMGGRPGESALGTVIGDLAEAGYVGSWSRIRASEVGAPHRRERVFIIAADAERLRIDAGSELRGGSTWEPGRSSQAPLPTGSQVARAAHAFADSAVATDTGRERLDGSGGRDTEGAAGEGNGRSGAEGLEELAPDPDGGRRALFGESESARIEGSSGNVADGRDREGEASADTDGERREEHGRTVTVEEALTSPDGDSVGREWGIYAPAVLRWERVLGRSAPRPTDDRGRLNPEFSGWMLGFPAGWTEGENRTQRLRMLGNAVQVQVGQVVGGMLRG